MGAVTDNGAVGHKLPTVTYVEADGEATTVEIAEGKSLLFAGQAANVAGLLGECGGQLMCATCHVYVEEAYLTKLPPIGEEEDVMLEETVCERKHNSRLSCQLTSTTKLDGMVLLLPEEQV